MPANGVRSADPPSSAEPSNDALVVELTGDQLEHLADLLADRLRPSPSNEPRVTAVEMAALLGCNVKTVYRHADDWALKGSGVG